MSFDPATIESFRYEGFDIDAASATVTCRYALGAWRFAERVSFDPSGDSSPPAVARAARLVYLLAGVSYYKAAAPPVIDFGDESLTAIVRAGRALDPQILNSKGLGFRNGHVPVTGIISAIAVMAAVVDGRDAVVMSNEWSASQGNMAVDGRVVNHQYSKSYAFEAAFRA